MVGLGTWINEGLAPLQWSNSCSRPRSRAKRAFEEGFQMGDMPGSQLSRRGLFRRAAVLGGVAAAGGGLAGAWLGFHATDGLLSLITTIVGATVGANLILLALDISWDRQGSRMRSA